MMAPAAEMTEYERRRLENIRRNEEMVASLKLHSRAADLSAASKRLKVEMKTHKVAAKPKPETPVVMRRSLRTRGLPPDLKGLTDQDSGGPEAVSESPKVDPKASAGNVAGPVSMRDAYQGSGSDHALREIIMSFRESGDIGSSVSGGLDKSKVWKVGNPCDSAEGLTYGYVKRESDHGDSGNAGSSEGAGDNTVKVEGVDEVKGCKQERPFDSVVAATGFSLNHIVNREDGDEASGSPTLKQEHVAKKQEFDGGEGCKVENLSDLNRNESENLPPSFNIRCEGDPEALVDINRLTLNEKNIARVVPGSVMVIKFFPTPNMRMITVGNKFGNVGFWNMESREAEDGIFLYRTHPGAVSGISIPEFNLRKMFSCCNEGFLRVMDVEKEIFDLVYETDQAIFSLCHQPSNPSCLYFGEGRGGLKFCDDRTGKVSASWDLHGERINTIDFNPKNPNIMATSSSDGLAFIWDMRNISSGRLKHLGVVNQKNAVHSAHFSPSGSFLATSSGFGNSVGITSGPEFKETAKVSHNYHTGRRISSFRPIWGWDDSYIFVGNMKRALDVISQPRRTIICCLESPHLTSITCRLAAHPFEVGTIAGATGGGQVYTWTSR